MSLNKDYKDHVNRLVNCPTRVALTWDDDFTQSTKVLPGIQHVI